MDIVHQVNLMNLASTTYSLEREKDKEREKPLENGSTHDSGNKSFCWLWALNEFQVLR